MENAQHSKALIHMMSRWRCKALGPLISSQNAHLPAMDSALGSYGLMKASDSEHAQGLPARGWGGVVTFGCPIGVA